MPLKYRWSPEPHISFKKWLFYCFDKEELPALGFRISKTNVSRNFGYFLIYNTVLYPEFNQGAFLLLFCFVFVLLPLRHTGKALLQRKQ